MRNFHNYIKETIDVETARKLNELRNKLARDEHYRYLAYLERERQIAEGTEAA